MKRYLLFVGDTEDTCGGSSDFVMDFDSRDELAVYLTINKYEHYSITDSFNGAREVVEG